MFGWGSARKAPRIALTYDDGPTEHTDELLEVLESAGAGATFFVTGDSVAARPDVLRRIADTERMEIGNHSITHPDLWDVDDQQAEDEVVQSQRLIANVIGRATPLFRPPRGHHDHRTRRWAAESGQAIILWTLTSMDWKHHSAAKTASLVCRSARDGDIVLLHDSVASTVEGTRLIVDGLTRRGYQFVTVSELLGASSPGEVYKGTVGAHVLFARKVKDRLVKT